MKILALESSAKAVSCCLAEDGHLVAQTFQNNGLTHSRTLLPMVTAMLEQCGISLQQVDVIAVANGPGSFTGLRIGIATAKGLAWPEKKSTCAVSTLEAMARLPMVEQGLICCAMDARRKQVYNALFRVEKGTVTRLCPDRAIGLAELFEELKQADGPVYLVGDGAELCQRFGADSGVDLRLTPEHLRQQAAWGVAAVAAEKAAAGDILSPEELVPNYLRLSQAERERLEREKRLPGDSQK